MKVSTRPVTLMFVAQIVCALAIPLTIFAFLPSIVYAGIFTFTVSYELDNTLLVAANAVIHALRDIALCCCLAYAEFEAFRLCGRMRRASAFSAANVSGLGRIMAALSLAGGVSLICGDPLIPFLLAGLADISPIVTRLLLPFTLLTLALMLRAVQVLMRRAVDMQEESDLTV